MIYASDFFKLITKKEIVYDLYQTLLPWKLWNRVFNIQASQILKKLAELDSTYVLICIRST